MMRRPTSSLLLILLCATTIAGTGVDIVTQRNLRRETRIATVYAHVAAKRARRRTLRLLKAVQLCVDDAGPDQLPRTMRYLGLLERGRL